MGRIVAIYAIMLIGHNMLYSTNCRQQKHTAYYSRAVACFYGPRKTVWDEWHTHLLSSVCAQWCARAWYKRIRSSRPNRMCEQVSATRQRWNTNNVKLLPNLLESLYSNVVANYCYLPLLLGRLLLLMFCMRVLMMTEHHNICWVCLRFRMHEQFAWKYGVSRLPEQCSSKHRKRKHTAYG